MAKTPRTWTGARTPSGLKRVRQSERRRAVLQPRRTAAKTLVAKAVSLATTPTDGADPQVALAEAMSALDRAAKVGAIHPNAAARRKSRLARKVVAALGGISVQAAHVSKTTGRAAAAKAAKARIAAAKATKAKGAQTAAGKARAALSKTTRADAAEGRATAAASETVAAPKTTRAKAATKASAAGAATSGTADKPKATRSTATKATTAKSTRTKKAE